MVNVNTNEATNVGTNSATLNGELTEFAVTGYGTYQNSGANDVRTISIPEGEYVVEVHGAKGGEASSDADDRGSSGSGGKIVGEISVGSLGTTWDLYLAEAGDGYQGGTGYDDGGDSSSGFAGGGGGGATVIWSQELSEEIATAGGGGGGGACTEDALGNTYAKGGGGGGSGGNGGSASGADNNVDGQDGGGYGGSGGDGGDASYPTAYNGKDGYGLDLNNRLSNVTATKGGSDYLVGTIIIKEKIDTDVRFGYGTSSVSSPIDATDYQYQTPTQTITLDTTLPESFSEALTGLRDGDIYYFRAFIQGGDDSGSELSFTTIEILELLLDDDLFFSEYNSVDEYYLDVITKYADNIDSDSARLVGKLVR